MIKNACSCYWTEERTQRSRSTFKTKKWKEKNILIQLMISFKLWLLYYKPWSTHRSWLNSKVSGECQIKTDHLELYDFINETHWLSALLLGNENMLIQYSWPGCFQSLMNLLVLADLSEIHKDMYSCKNDELSWIACFPDSQMLLISITFFFKPSSKHKC